MRIRSLLTVAGGFRLISRQSLAPPVSMVTGARLRSSCAPEPEL